MSRSRTHAGLSLIDLAIVITIIGITLAASIPALSKLGQSSSLMNSTENPENIAGELNHQQENNVEGSGAEPSILPAPVDLDLQAMAAQLGAMAEITTAGGTYTGECWGGLDDYTIVRSTGSLHLSGNNSGGGILIIEGDFTCTGQFTWYGLVLVLGEINFTGGGAGIHLYGSILAEGGISQNVMGGNADIKYSSIALARIATLFPYIVASWMET